MRKPKNLADELRQWRGDLSRTKAAEILGIPAKTLEHIEYGRAFRYPVLLRQALRTLTNEGEWK